MCKLLSADISVNSLQKRYSRSYILFWPNMDAKLLLLGICSLLSLCDTFLLDPKNVTTVTAKEFMELLDLIMEEKQLRHLLQHSVEVLQQQVNSQQSKYDTLEKEFKALNLSHSKLETKYQDLVQGGINNYTSQNVYHDIDSLYRNLSKADSDLERKYQNLSKAYNEIDTKLQNMTLQKDTTPTINSQNLSLAYTEIKETLQNLSTTHQEMELRNLNLTKTNADIFMKLSTAYIDMRAKYQNLSFAYLEMETDFQNLSKENTILAAANRNMSKALSDMKETVANLSHSSYDLELNYNNLSSEFNDLDKTFKNLSQANMDMATRYQNISRTNLELEMKYQNLSKANNDMESRFKNLAVNFFDIDTKLRALKQDNADLLNTYPMQNE